MTKMTISKRTQVNTRVLTFRWRHSSFLAFTGNSWKQGGALSLRAFSAFGADGRGTGPLGSEECKLTFYYTQAGGWRVIRGAIPWIP